MMALLPLFIILLLSGCVSLPPTPDVTTAQRVAWKKARTGEFAWGIAASSYQYEDPGVPPSDRMYFQTDWETLIEGGRAPIKGNADYSWTLWKKDLQALEKIKPTHYRFSVEWARIEPQPGVYNESAIRNYVNRARQLKAIGIEPIVCLWHFTFPIWLYDRRHPVRSNWLHPLADSHWRAFVTKMVRAFGSDVRFYAPQNEPNGQLTTAYIAGLWPPARILDYSNYRRALDASVRQFRESVAIIRSLRKDAVIISVEALPWWQHSRLDPGNVFYNMMQRFNFDHLDRTYDVCDVMGINYYYSQVAGLASLLTFKAHDGPCYSSIGWRIDPIGLYNNIEFVANRYGKPMMITENGVAVDRDSKRLDYIRKHIAMVELAKKNGYDVRGYFVWSLADNYEWHYGYKAKFGLCAIDPYSMDRILRPSAFYFRNIVSGHAEYPRKFSSIYLYWLYNKQCWQEKLRAENKNHRLH
jgi:beta-glucosidase